MQLEDLRLFVAAIEERSFTAAAEKLGVSKQFVSRRTMALEEQLGVRLLNRTTRSLQPTDLGMTLYERAVRILDDVKETEELVCSHSAMLRGRLRVSAPVTFGTMHISPLVGPFLQQHPLLALDLDLTDRNVDLVAEGYDMAIRGGPLHDSTLIARRLASVQMVACASPHYLAHHPAPASPQALREHECLLFGQGGNVEWTFRAHDKPLTVAVKGRLRANTGEIVRDAAVAGMGIAFLPRFMVATELAAGRLVSVLDDYRPAGPGVHAVYPRHRQASRAVQSLVGFLQERLVAE